MSKPFITTVTCTHQPRLELLERVLRSLVNQVDMEDGSYEIVVVDNRSPDPIESRIAADLCSRVRFVREDALGLTPARLKGLRTASADLLVMVDDDNVLAGDYLSRVRNAFLARPRLGALGGKALPVFEAPPPEWFSIKAYSLGCRDLGEAEMFASWSADPDTPRMFPACAPIGGGMAIRRAPFEAYAAALQSSPVRQKLDRTGESLASGGDNDIVLTALGEGFEVGYDPALRLDHHIPTGRLELSYLQRYQRESTRTWVQVLGVHGILPWTPIAPWTLAMRRARAYWRLRAWQSPTAMLNWQAACGMFEGRAALRDMLKQ